MGKEREGKGRERNGKGYGERARVERRGKFLVGRTSRSSEILEGLRGAHTNPSFRRIRPRRCLACVNERSATCG